MEPGRLAYALRFHRPPKTAAAPEPVATAPSAAMTTAISDGDVRATLSAIPGGEAVLGTHYRLNHDGSMFFEWGTIDFGGAGLRFGSVGAGTMLGPAAADGFSHGVVLWRVESGWGAFEGATGAITSNFLVALETQELIDYQFHVIQLPVSSR